jgi:cation:H+ antiporter
MGLATASPEISVNLASVGFGWPDLGLGAALGSNVPALPLIVLISYLATRHAAESDGPENPPPPRVQPEAVPVQVVPYLLVLVLLAGLTLPPAWSGLQPIDGVILAGAFAAYLVYVLRQARPEKREPSAPCDYRHALIGLPAIAAGALASVIAARRLTDAWGISDLVGGLFIIGLLCALPESFAAWRLARERKATTAVSGAVADGIVSLTLALLPPAMVGAAVGNLWIYGINLAFLFAALIAYLVLNHRSRGQELGVGRVSLYVGGYGLYVLATVFVLIR